MLKPRLTTLDGLDPLIAAEYKAQDGVFVLDLEGGPPEDVGPLKRALDHERTQNTERQKRITELEGTLVIEKAARGTPSDIEKAWQKKFDDQTKALNNEKQTLRAQLERKLVDDVAMNLAASVSKSPSLILPHIKSRLAIEEVSGELVTRVLDENGKVTALTVNEFREKVVADPLFAPIITASQASGSGAQGSGGGTGGGAKGFKEMSEAERVALFKTNRPEYDRLKALQ